MHASLAPKIPDNLREELWLYVFRHVPKDDIVPLLSVAEEIRYPVDAGKRTKSVADVLEERGFKRGIEQGIVEGLERGKSDVLVRLVRKRFGLSPDEEMLIQTCRDVAKLDAAAEEYANQNATKEFVLRLLSQSE